MKNALCRKLILISALIAFGQSSLAAGERCEYLFASQVLNEAGSEIIVNVDGRALSIPTGTPYIPPEHQTSTESVQENLSYGTRVGSSLSQSLMTLAFGGELIKQTDSRLQKRNLLVPNGGLCSSTCAANVLHAVARYTNGDTRLAGDRLIHQIVDFVKREFNHDARIGLAFEELNPALQELAKDFGLRLTTDHVKLGQRFNAEINDSGFSELSLSTDRDSIALLVVRTAGNTSHALILERYNRITKKAYINDPNFPGMIRELDVTSTVENSFPTLKLNNLGYGTESRIGTILSILYVKAEWPIESEFESQFSKYLGKRVLIHRKNGEKVKMLVDSLKFASHFGEVWPGVYGRKSSPDGRSKASAPFHDIESIVEIHAPEDLGGFTRLVGKTIRAKFEPDSFEDGVYEVTGFKDPWVAKDLPNGGLQMRNTTEGWSIAVPFDVIVSIDVVH